MNIAHPSADALLSACARRDWPQASRHWRSLPHMARQELASMALFCALAAMRESGSTDRPEADQTLRSICAVAVDAPAGRLNAEAGRSLSADCVRLGLWQCFSELERSEACRPAGPGLEACLGHWRGLYFPSDARAFLSRFSEPELRGGLEMLRSLCSWADSGQMDALEATRGACDKSSKRFWPDARDDMAAKGALALAARIAQLAAPSQESIAKAPAAPLL